MLLYHAFELYHHQRRTPIMPPAAKHGLKPQEALILAATAYCIKTRSLLDFTMSAIAKTAGVSIEMPYKHVQSKEDVLEALGTRMSQQLQHIFVHTLSLEYA